MECFDKHIKTDAISTDKHDKQRILCEKNFKELEETSSQVQLMTLKLMKNIHNIIQTTKLFAADTFKLLGLKNIETISKKFQEIDQLYGISLKKHADQTSCFQTAALVSAAKEDALDRLAQQLEICFQYGFASCKKQDIKALFMNGCFGCADEDANLLSMVLNC